MIMNNFLKARKAALGFPDITCVDSGGGTKTLTAGSQPLHFPNMNKVMLGDWGAGIWLCDAAAGLSPSDYSPNDSNVNGWAVTNLGCSVYYTKTVNGDTLTHKSLITATNNSASDVTIREIAYFEKYTGLGSSPALVEKSVLETPVVIPANGGVAQITYEIALNVKTTE